MATMMTNPSGSTSALGAIAGLVATLVAGCSQCSDGPRVPFALGRATSAPPKVQSPSGDEAASLRRGVVQVLDPGRRTTSIAGAEVTSLEGDLRAVGAFPRADSTHFVTVARADSSVVLSSAYEAARAARGDWVRRARLPLPESCELAAASLRRLTDDWVLSTTDVACAGGPAEGYSQLWIVGLGDSAQPRLSFRVLGPQSPQDPGLTLSVQVVDRDVDDHLDVLVRVGLADGAPAEMWADLVWLNRSSGLVLGRSEPSQQLRTYAAQAEEQLSERPGAAARSARGIRALFDALCGLSDRPRLALETTLGAPCSAMPFAQATGLLAISALREGDVERGLALMYELETRSMELPISLKDALERSVHSIAVADVVSAVGPSMPPALDSGHGEGLSLLGFIDEQTLLLRSASPLLYRVEDRRAYPAAPVKAERRIISSSGQQYVSSVEHSCTGVAIRTQQSSIGGHVSTLPLFAHSAAFARECAASRFSRSAYPPVRVLGWAPQGLVVLSVLRPWVLPTDRSHRPAGDPFAVSNGSNMPVPLQAGFVAPDGSAVVMPTRWGLIVRNATDAQLWEPPAPHNMGLTHRTQAAVATGAKRLAYVHRGQVILLQRGEPSKTP